MGMFSRDDWDMCVPQDLSETYYGIRFEHGIACNHCFGAKIKELTPTQYKMLRILRAYDASWILENHLENCARELAKAIDEDLIRQLREDIKYGFI